MTNWLRRLWTRGPRASAPTNRPARLTLEAMEPREVPAALAGNGIALPIYNGVTDSAVEVVNPAAGPTFLTSFPGLRGRITAAAGDLNGDGVSDAVVAVQGANGLVLGYNGATGGLLGLAALFPGYTGPVNVGTADLRGDGFADVLVTADVPGVPVLELNFHTGQVGGFLALPGFTGLASVTGADLTGDGRDEVVLGVPVPGFGGAVLAYTADGALAQVGPFAFPGFGGGISVAGGDVTGDGRDDIIVGAGPGSPGGEVKVFDGTTGALVTDFLPFVRSVTSGVNVYVADGNGDGVGDVYVALQGGYPILAGFSGRTGLSLALSTGGPGTSSGDDTGSDDASGGGFVSSDYVPPPPDIPAPDSYSYSPPPDTSTDTTSYDPGTDYTYDYSTPDYYTPDYSAYYYSTATDYSVIDNSGYYSAPDYSADPTI
jgi:hypothetical protein